MDLLINSITSGAIGLTSFVGTYVLTALVINAVAVVFRTEKSEAIPTNGGI